MSWVSGQCLKTRQLGLDMIDRLPQGWNVVQIGQVADLINGYSQFNSESYVDNGIPIFRIGDLGDPIDLTGVKRVAKNVVPNLDRKCLLRGDILIAKIGQRVGVSSVYNFDAPAIMSSQVAGVRPKGINSTFLGAFIESRFFYDAIKPYFFGSTRDNISTKQIGLTPIPFPPILIQRKISTLLGNYDNLIENNTRRIKILEEMAGTIYREWFVEFRFPGHENVKMVESELGLIPQGWEIKGLGDVSLNFDRLRKPLSGRVRSTMQGEYPYYGAASILDHVNDYLFDGRYLLIGEDGSVITKDGRPVLQLVAGKFWANNHTHVVQGKSPISTNFLYLLMSNVAISSYITGTAQPKINQENLNRIPVVSPPRDLLERFDQIINPIYDDIVILDRKNINLRKTRDMLLPKLISGEIDVSELDIKTDTIQSDLGNCATSKSKIE